MPGISCILESAGCLKLCINSASRLNVDLAVESGLAGPDRAEGAKEQGILGRSCVETLYWVLFIITLLTSIPMNEVKPNHLKARFCKSGVGDCLGSITVTFSWSFKP